MGKAPGLRFANRSVLSLGVIGLVGAWGFTSYRHHTQFAGTENYAIGYPARLTGWKMLPPSPESLFMFEDVKRSMTIRGSVSQVIADVNPTPEMDTDGMAKFYIDRTHENMPDWTAERVNDYKTSHARFSVIQRQTKGRTVVTAFTVKGNTTLMVCVTAKSVSPSVVSQAIGALDNCLSQIKLTESDMGGGAKAAL